MPRAKTNPQHRLSGIILSPPDKSTLKRREVAESILGKVDWKDQDHGYVTCPGVSHHTTRSGRRDTKVFLDAAPTLYCFHQSCRDVVESVNHTLRREIGRLEKHPSAKPEAAKKPPEQIRREKEQERQRQLERRVARLKDHILSSYWHAGASIGAELWERSPTRLEHQVPKDWRLLITLFDPDDVVWIGALYDSGEPKHQRCFQPVRDWLKAFAVPGQFTCPSTFKPGVCSRSNGNVVCRRFLVVESDDLAKEETLSLFFWVQQCLPLRAIVDTGGKSLHGWFDPPDEKTESELQVILPALGCDDALFKPSQPCRLPGARRDENQLQQLLYFNPRKSP